MPCCAVPGPSILTHLLLTSEAPAEALAETWRQRADLHPRPCAEGPRWITMQKASRQRRSVVPRNGTRVVG